MCIRNAPPMRIIICYSIRTWFTIYFSWRYFPWQLFYRWIFKAHKVWKISGGKKVTIEGCRRQRTEIRSYNYCEFIPRVSSWRYIVNRKNIFVFSSSLLWVHALASILFVLAGIVVAYLYTNATRYYSKEEMVRRRKRIVRVESILKNLSTKTKNRWKK